MPLTGENRTYTEPVLTEIRRLHTEIAHLTRQRDALRTALAALVAETKQVGHIAVSVQDCPFCVPMKNAIAAAEAALKGAAK